MLGCLHLPFPPLFSFFAFGFVNTYQPHECQQTKPQENDNCYHLTQPPWPGQGCENTHLSEQTLLHESWQHLFCCLLPLLILPVFVVLHCPAHFQIFLFHLSENSVNCHFVLRNIFSPLSKRKNYLLTHFAKVNRKIFTSVRGFKRLEIQADQRGSADLSPWAEFGAAHEPRSAFMSIHD